MVNFKRETKGSRPRFKKPIFKDFDPTSDSSQPRVGIGHGDDPIPEVQRLL